jgi:hypothetical protein
VVSKGFALSIKPPLGVRQNNDADIAHLGVILDFRQNSPLKNEN